MNTLSSRDFIALTLAGFMLLPLAAQAKDLKAANPDMQSPEKVFQQYDFDKSGSLNESEFMSYAQNAGGQAQAGAEAAFEQGDANHDDALTVEEFKIAMAPQAKPAPKPKKDGIPNQ